MNPQVKTEPTDTVTGADIQDTKASFAETALKLGGKSEDEARRMGAVDKADDQVEELFAKRFQTVNSPVHRAVWDRELPIELFQSRLPQTPPEVDRVMRDSLEVMTKHVKAKTNLDEKNKVPQHVLDELGEVGYWGLLVDKNHGGSGAPFVSFAPFLTKMAMVDATVAGLASVHGCIGAVDPVRTFGNPEQKAAVPARPGQRQAAVGLRPDRAERRQRPDGPANHGRPRWRLLRRQRREAVHHQRRARADRSAWSA